LFSGTSDRPITYWNAAEYVPIVKVEWSTFRPLVFFALDADGRFVMLSLLLLLFA
jgi:hypothetical protein